MEGAYGVFVHDARVQRLGHTRCTHKFIIHRTIGSIIDIVNNAGALYKGRIKIGNKFTVLVRMCMCARPCVHATEVHVSFTYMYTCVCAVTYGDGYKSSGGGKE